MHYVCSDIHGHGKLWHKLLAELNLQSDDVLYVLGDVIDRGRDSIEILQDIMARPNVVMFLGNHEHMMLSFLAQSGRYYDAWLYQGNGGRLTHSAFEKLPEDEQNRIINFLYNSYIQIYVEVQGERYALHHSAFLTAKSGKDVLCKDQPLLTSFDAVWNSPYRFLEYFPEICYDDGCTHIIGHVPVQVKGLTRPPLYGEVLVEKLIDIDGGCALISKGRRGGLYCMSLEKDEEGKRREFWIRPSDVV